MRACWRVWILVAAVITSGIALQRLGASVTTPQGLILRSFYLPGVLPFDPNAGAWEKATPLVLSLSGRVVTQPTRPAPSVRSLTVRSFHNGKDIAFWLGWQDPTKNDALLPGKSRDAAALAVTLFPNDRLACMGQVHPDSPINIWHWKADWQTRFDGEQREREAQRDRRPRPRHPVLRPRHASSVEDLVAVEALLSAKAVQGLVQGKAIWDQGEWKVVLWRARLATPTGLDDPKLSAPPFSLGDQQTIAFAVWDGDPAERGGQKAIGPWVQLTLDPISLWTDESETNEVATITRQFGAAVTPLDEQERKRSHFAMIEGLVVKDVAKGSLADAYGLGAGHVILGINDKKVRNLDEFERTLRAAIPLGNMTFCLAELPRYAEEIPLIPPCAERQPVLHEVDRP